MFSKKKYSQLCDFGSSNIVVGFHFMSVRPDPFACTAYGPDNDVFQIECFWFDSNWTNEEKIRSQMKKCCAAEMKLYFRDHEMGKNETFAELERIGFTSESELEYILLDAFAVVVECENDEIIPIGVSSSIRFVEIANET
jgi:hypothetical protein